jgi:hypothetical protein
LDTQDKFASFHFCKIFTGAGGLAQFGTVFFHHLGEMDFVFHWAGRITENVEFGNKLKETRAKIKTNQPDGQDLVNV